MEAVGQFIMKLMSGVGDVILVPAILTVMGVLVGTKPSKAIRAGLVTAVALTGIYTILGLFLGGVGPVAGAISERFASGFKLHIMDVGWTVSFVAGFTAIGLSYVFAGVAMNVALIMLGWVKTLEISLVEPIIAQSVIGYSVNLITGNYWLGMLSALIVTLISLKLSDWQAEKASDFFGFKGIALVQVGVNESSLIAWPIVKLLDKIPSLREGKFTAEWVRKKFGVFGEPMFVGAGFGIILGILGGYDAIEVITLAITLAASLNLMPRMVGILMEGFMPIQTGVRKWLTEHAKGRTIYVGLDPALGTGHPAVLATAMLMMPITLLIALLLPGNRVLPMGNLSVLTFSLMFCVVMNKGDILRSVITSIPVVIFMCYSSTLAGPYTNMVFLEQGLIEPQAGVVAGGFSVSPWTWMFCKLFEWLGLAVRSVV